MGRFFLIIVLTLSPLSAKELSWSKVQKLDDYKAARSALTDRLPALAIPHLEGLIAMKNIAKPARQKVTLLLGEAQLRAGQAEKALETLTPDSSAKALIWRAHALAQLGRLKEAEETLAPVKGATAARQRALLLASLNDPAKALTILTPLLKKDIEAQLLAASIHLDTNQLNQADALLKSVRPKTPFTEVTHRFLNGRLQLSRKERVAAIGTFQAILAAKGTEQRLPAAHFYESSLALADSIALEDNEADAVTFLIDTLEKYPDHPRLEEIFSRLHAWKIHVPAQKLERWTASPAPPMIGLAPASFLKKRDAYALHLLALINLESEQPTRGQFLLSRLLFEVPGALDALTNRALLDLGVHHLKLGRSELALSIFQLATNRSQTREFRAVAKSLEGTAAFSLQDPKQAAAAFAEAENLAKEYGNAVLARTAELNAGLSLLQSGKQPDWESLTESSRTTIQLERGLLLSQKDDVEARVLLEGFLADFPAHPRRKEAALALAENCIFVSPKDPSLAQQHLQKLDFNLATEIEFAALKIECLLALGQGFQLAKQFLAKHPEHPSSAMILFREGQALTRTGKSGEAFVRYEQLLQAFPKSPLADTARMLSAQAAFSVGNAAAEQRAFERYQDLIEGGGPLAMEAAIERARLRIDRDECAIALEEILPLLKQKKLRSNSRRRLLVLAAEAAVREEEFTMALGHYDQLLAEKDLPVSWFNQASFLKGRVLEDLEEPNQALATYRKVVDNNFNPEEGAELEWKWHDRCALEGALPLLERMKEWDAALALTRKVATSGGPSAERAAERAKKIQLDHMIYEPEEPARAE